MENQIMMVLSRLRINLPFEYLDYQTGFSKSTVNQTFHKILDLLYYKISFLVKWSDRDDIFQTIPSHFKQYFPKLTSASKYLLTDHGT